MGIATAHLEGKISQSLVTVSPKKMDVLHWSSDHLSTLAQQWAERGSRWLNIDAADLAHLGQDQLFVTVFLEGPQRFQSVGFTYHTSQFQATNRLEGCVRLIQKPDGGPMLVWQSVALSRELQVLSPREVVVSPDGQLSYGKNLNLSSVNENQLFGFTFGGWLDKGADLASLQSDDALGVFGVHTRWIGKESWGGTKNSFPIQPNHLMDFPSKLWTLKTPGGPDQLLILRNIPELGLRTSFLKKFKRAELTSLIWDGHAMVARWTLAQDGTISDFAVGDVFGRGVPQLWISSTDLEGRSTLAAYELP